MSPIRPSRVAACCLALAAATAAPAPAWSSSYRVLHSFGCSYAASGYPAFGLTALGGLFYGVAPGRHSYEVGSVFSIDPGTGTETTLYVFQGGSDGSSPQGGLVAFGGLLYGTTEQGATRDAGTIFSIDPATGAERVVYDFGGRAHGGFPAAGLVAAGGRLWGDTVLGGIRQLGVLFTFNPATGTETVVHDFAGQDDGRAPELSLLKYGQGLLAGVTPYGGISNQGTVFSLDIPSQAFTTLHLFRNKADGSVPASSLTRVGNQLYGTTQDGGASGDGTVFAVNPATGAETVLHSFDDVHGGASPQGGLTKVGNRLYGTTASNPGGAIYSLSLDGQHFKVLHVFGHEGGYEPSGNLLYVGDTLYGTTRLGGANDCGTVFAFVP